MERKDIEVIIEQVLERRYGLKPTRSGYEVKDGWVHEGDTVWWLCDPPPAERVKVGDPAHMRNMREFPEVYQIKEPKVRTTYLD